MNAVTLTPLRRIPTPKGDVLHCLKASDDSFAGFGEAYLSMVGAGQIKGWKRHQRMVLNLVVVSGSVRFVAYDSTSPAQIVSDVVLGPDASETHQRLTVQPGIWLAFRGEGATDSIVLNVASLPHDPSEADGLDLSALEFPTTRSVGA